MLFLQFVRVEGLMGHQPKVGHAIIKNEKGGGHAWDMLWRQSSLVDCIVNINDKAVN